MRGITAVLWGLLSGWRGRRTLWWRITFFQILAPSKKVSARWEDISFLSVIVSSYRVCAALLLFNRSAVLIVLFRPSVPQPREEMVFSGKYKTGEQILRLANERFAVPEMLFHPADIGIQEMGIPEAIVDSIQSLPEGQRSRVAAGCSDTTTAARVFV